MMTCLFTTCFFYITHIHGNDGTHNTKKCYIYMCVKYIIPLININDDVIMNTEDCFERKIDCIKSFTC